MALLASPSEGGAFGAGSHRAMRDSTAGDSGILLGVLGGLGEAFIGLAIEFHAVISGMVMEGYLFLFDLVLAALFRFDSVAKLVGSLETESRREGQESLNSVSWSLASLASYKSSKSAAFWVPSLALEGEESLEKEDGVRVVESLLFFGAATKYFASRPAGLPMTVPSSVSVPLPLPLPKVVS